jgi:cytidylate kinase
MPVLTISRMPGALGDEIAQSVAEQLGFRLVSRQELARLASGPPGSRDEPAWEHSLQDAERSPSFFQRLTADRRSYARSLRRAVVELAQQGDVIIVGLGGGQVLQGLHQVLRTLVIAPEEVRVARLIEANVRAAREHVLSHEEARTLVRRHERDTAGYMRYLFQIDWLDACHWDLVINTGRFSLDEAVAILAATVQGGLLIGGPGDRHRLADLVLTGHVEKALSDLDTLWIDGMDVQAHRGRVVLDGTVTCEAERGLAEETVRAVDGVQGMDNKLRIQNPELPWN